VLKSIFWPLQSFERALHLYNVFFSLYCNIFRCKELLLQAINKQYPYYNKPVHVQEYYLHNLLTMLAYQPSLKEDILHLIFSK